MLELSNREVEILLKVLDRGFHDPSPHNDPEFRRSLKLLVSKLKEANLSL